MCKKLWFLKICVTASQKIRYTNFRENSLVLLYKKNRSKLEMEANPNLLGPKHTEVFFRCYPKQYGKGLFLFDHL